MKEKGTKLGSGGREKLGSIWKMVPKERTQSRHEKPGELASPKVNKIVRQIQGHLSKH